MTSVTCFADCAPGTMRGLELGGGLQGQNAPAHDNFLDFEGGRTWSGNFKFIMTVVPYFKSVFEGTGHGRMAL